MNTFGQRSALKKSRKEDQNNLKFIILHKWQASWLIMIITNNY